MSKFKPGDFIIVIKKIIPTESFNLGDKGFVVSQHKYGFYTVSFENGVTCSGVYCNEIDHNIPESDSYDLDDNYIPEDSYLIIVPHAAFYITPCSDAPGTWFDHSTGNFLSKDKLQTILDGYRSVGVPVL